MATKPAADETERADAPDTADRPLPAEPQYAIEITMSPAEMEKLRSDLKKFH